MRLHISVSSELSQLVHACECVCPYGCICCFPQEESGAQEGSEHGECGDMGAESTKVFDFWEKTQHGSQGCTRGFIVVNRCFMSHAVHSHSNLCVCVCETKKNSVIDSRSITIKKQTTALLADESVTHRVRSEMAS